jgi:hypothetical protein
MATILDALRTKFLQDCRWFNDDEFSTGPSDQYDRFDDNVAMKKIDDPGDYHRKKSAVRAYFNGTGTNDKAKFAPDTGPGQPTFELVGALGFVSGTAQFQYRSVPSTDGPATDERPIAYSFTYTIVNGDWKAIHLWGQYIDGKPASRRRVTKRRKRPLRRKSRRS